MSFYGVCGGALHWIRSYLTQRKRYVSINGINSVNRLIECGVPQGYIFQSIAVSHIFQQLSQIFKLLQFHDNTLTFKFKNTSPDEISNLLSITLKDIFHWINVIILKVITSKCKFISFSYHKKLSLPLISIDSCFHNFG